jgi:hypothetical protein
MGYWGVKSYENDDADVALDAAFEEVHGDLYVELMDDLNPLSFEQVQKRLADGRTLTAAITILQEMVGATLTSDRGVWDEAARLALAGIVVRHAECDVPIPHDLLNIALEWLEHEDLEWDEDTKRRLRRDKEIALLRKPRAATVSNEEIR